MAKIAQKKNDYLLLVIEIRAMPKPNLTIYEHHGWYYLSDIEIDFAYHQLPLLKAGYYIAMIGDKNPTIR